MSAAPNDGEKTWCLSLYKLMIFATHQNILLERSSIPYERSIWSIWIKTLKLFVLSKSICSISIGNKLNAGRSSGGDPKWPQTQARKRDEALPEMTCTVLVPGKKISDYSLIDVLKITLDSTYKYVPPSYYRKMICPIV